MVDALNLPFVTNDAKEARSLFAYDNLQRPIFVWARDKGSEAVTKRQIMRYGDSDGLPNPEIQNLKGKLYVHNDEAGRLVYEEYDFKGNNLEFYRLIINDDALTVHILRNIVFVFIRWLSMRQYGDKFLRVVVVCPFERVLATKNGRKEI